MNKLGFRLVGSFLIVLLMVVAVGLYSSVEGQRSLQEAIGKNSMFLANQMLENINNNIANWFDRFEIRALGELFITTVEDSNHEYASKASIGSYLDQLGTLEKSSNDSTKEADKRLYTKQLNESYLSKTLRTAYIDYYTDRKEKIAISEMVVTNKYGAVVAFAGSLSKYRFDEDPLWKLAMESGTQMGKFELDDNKAILLPIAVPIFDGEGSTVGLLMAKVYADALIVDAISDDEKYENTQVQLITGEGKMIYATLPFVFNADMSDQEYYRKLKTESGWFVGYNNEQKTLFAYSKTQAVADMNSVPIILVLSNKVSEVLTTSYVLRNKIIVISALLLIFGIVIALFITHSITGPVIALQSAVGQITKGDLSLVIDTRRKDELGMLSRSLAELQASLAQIAVFSTRIAEGDLAVQVIKRSDSDKLGESLENMLNNLRKQSTEIIEGVNILSVATGEISVSTSQFAANSSETAAAVNQTTTTIEEVKQTTHLSNEKAKQMAEGTRRTETIAQAGMNSVEETAKAMGLIQEHMSTIGESIIRLNGQGVSIGEITETVSELADQSNLLAVNAAIEAAKAGEQGRGFVVVAQEIRTLAEQSKRATIQVRGILSELEAATKSAVLAMERGSLAAQQGMKQAVESRESIMSLTQTIEEAALGAELIAVSSEQQLVGMDQVAMAMESIQAATMQGVDGTRMLETATRNLHGVGQKLKQLVELTRM